MKKFFVFLMTALMLTSLFVPVFASGEGIITLNGAVEGGSYSLYRLLDLQAYNKNTGTYTYTVNDDWEDFFDTSEAKEYMSIDSDGYVTWVAVDDDETVAEFANLALDFAYSYGIDPAESSDDGDMTVEGEIGKFTGLDLGWYLVDNYPKASLCALTTTDPDASINAMLTITEQAETYEAYVEEETYEAYVEEETIYIPDTAVAVSPFNEHTNDATYISTTVIIIIIIIVVIVLLLAGVITLTVLLIVKSNKNKNH